MTVELFVGDVWQFVEVKGEFDARLDVWFCIVRELRVGKFVVDFGECHFESHVVRICSGDLIVFYVL